MSILIKKIFKTETAHIVRLASSQRCRESVHGHSYKWIVTILDEEKLKENGMVIDFIDLKPIKEFIDQFDHAMILWQNDTQQFKDFFLNNCERVIIMLKNTTAENMAKLIHKFTQDWLKISYPNRLLICKKVEVWETETGCGMATSSDNNDIIIIK